MRISGITRFIHPANLVNTPLRPKVGMYGMAGMIGFRLPAQSDGCSRMSRTMPLFFRDSTCQARRDAATSSMTCEFIDSERSVAVSRPRATLIEEVVP